MADGVEKTSFKSCWAYKVTVHVRGEETPYTELRMWYMDGRQERIKLDSRLGQSLLQQLAKIHHCDVMTREPQAGDSFVQDDVAFENENVLEGGECL